MIFLIFSPELELDFWIIIGFSILNKDKEDKDIEKDNVLALSELETRIKVFVKNDLKERQEKSEIIK